MSQITWHRLRAEDLKSSLFLLVDLIIFLSPDAWSLPMFISQSAALGCQGKQHLSVITRVTAWKEEALGLILISLPRSELWRCWTVAGSSSILHQHPTPRVTHGLLMMPECHYTSPRAGRETDLCLWCCEPWMSGQLSKARWGLEGKCISHYSAHGPHLSLGDPKRGDQTTSQLHYLDHTTLNLHKYWEPSDQWHAHNW